MEKDVLGYFEANDAKPKGVDGATVWTGWDHGIYGFWGASMVLFAVADVLVIISAGLHLSWFSI